MQPSVPDQLSSPGRLHQKEVGVRTQLRLAVVNGKGRRGIRVRGLDRAVRNILSISEKNAAGQRKTASATQRVTIRHMGISISIPFGTSQTGCCSCSDISTSHHFHDRMPGTHEPSLCSRRFVRLCLEASKQLANDSPHNTNIGPSSSRRREKQPTKVSPFTAYGLSESPESSIYSPDHCCQRNVSSR